MNVLFQFFRVSVFLRYTPFLIYFLMEGVWGMISSLSSLFCSIFWTCKREKNKQNKTVLPVFLSLQCYPCYFCTELYIYLVRLQLSCVVVTVDFAVMKWSSHNEICTIWLVVILLPSFSRKENIASLCLEKLFLDSVVCSGISEDGLEHLGEKRV